MIRVALRRSISTFLISAGLTRGAAAQQIMAGGRPARLDIRAAGAHAIRVTLAPLGPTTETPYSPAVAERAYPPPVVSVRTLAKPVSVKARALSVRVQPDPLTLVVTNTQGEAVQRIVFEPDGRLSFDIGDAPILGMGEGGPKPERGKPFREEAIQFDRRGALDTMEPRWQSDAYGSRNPAACSWARPDGHCGSPRRGFRSICATRIAVHSFHGNRPVARPFRRIRRTKGSPRAKGCRRSTRSFLALTTFSFSTRMTRRR